MTFEEAKKQKVTYPNPYRHEGNWFTVFVVPENQRDYINFISDLKAAKIANDEDAKSYSSDNKYMIMGLMMVAYNLTEINLQ